MSNPSYHAYPLAQQPTNSYMQQQSLGTNNVVQQHDEPPRVAPLCAVITHVILAATIAVLCYAIFGFDNPVALADNAYKFNWHPVLMVSAFAFFMGEAIIAYRLLPFSHQVQKGIHVALQTLALTAASVGLYYIISFHSDNKIDNFYNIHSILGIGTFSLFVTQYFLSVLSFVTPMLPNHQRAIIMPYHKYFGMLLFVLAWASMLTGLMDRERIIAKSVPLFSPIYNYANAAGMMIVLSGAVILFHLSPVSRVVHKEDGDLQQRLIR